MYTDVWYFIKLINNYDKHATLSNARRGMRKICDSEREGACEREFYRTGLLQIFKLSF